MEYEVSEKEPPVAFALGVKSFFLSLPPCRKVLGGYVTNSENRSDLRALCLCSWSGYLLGFPPGACTRKDEQSKLDASWQENMFTELFCCCCRQAKTSRSPDDEDSSSDSESEDEKKEAAAKAEEAAVVADAAAGHDNIRRSPVLTTSASTPTVSTPLKITTMGTHQRPVSSSSRSPRSPLMSRFQKSFSAKRDAASTVKSKSPRSTPPPPPGDDLLQAAAENEDKALDRRLVRQVTELFSRSMFIFSYDYGWLYRTL